MSVRLPLTGAARGVATLVGSAGAAGSKLGASERTCLAFFPSPKNKINLFLRISVDTGNEPEDTSILFYFNGEAGKRPMRLASLRAPSRLAQLKPDSLVQPKIRKAFPDTAF